VKIETFLKGDTMKINFQTAQLSRPQRESLLAVLDVLQSENENEIEVTPIEFPLKFRVKLDDNIEMVVGWNPESDSYSGITAKTEPEPKPESQKDTVDLPKPESTPEPEPTPAAELTKSVVGQRVEALARALVNLSKPLGSYQRCEIWSHFCEIYIKELIK